MRICGIQSFWWVWSETALKMQITGSMTKCVILMPLRFCFWWVFGSPHLWLRKGEGVSSRKCQAQAMRGDNNLGRGARERLVRDLSTAGDWGGRWPPKEAPKEGPGWRAAKCLLTSLLSSLIATPLWINQAWSDSQGLLWIAVFIH